MSFSYFFNVSTVYKVDTDSRQQLICTPDFRHHKILINNKLAGIFYISHENSTLSHFKIIKGSCPTRHAAQQLLNPSSSTIKHNNFREAQNAFYRHNVHELTKKLLFGNWFCLKRQFNLLYLFNFCSFHNFFRLCHDNWINSSNLKHLTKFEQHANFGVLRCISFQILFNL